MKFDFSGLPDAISKKCPKVAHSRITRKDQVAEGTSSSRLEDCNRIHIKAKCQWPSKKEEKNLKKICTKNKLKGPYFSQKKGQKEPILGRPDRPFLNAITRAVSFSVFAPFFVFPCFHVAAASQRHVTKSSEFLFAVFSFSDSDVTFPDHGCGNLAV